MTVLNNFTIRTRMTFAFILIIALFMVFGYISLLQMNTLSQLTATIYKHPLQVSNASLRARAGVISMHGFMRDVSIADTPMDVHIAIKNVQDQEQLVYKNLEIIQQLILGEEGRLLIEDTINLFAGWKPIRVEVEEFILKGDRKTAANIIKGKDTDYVDRLDRRMLELTSYALNKADEFMADAQTTKTQIITNLVFFIALLTGLIFTIGLLMSSSIMSNFSSLQQTMARITQTGKFEKANLIGNNEITLMAGYFNGLIERLEELFWLGKGENILNQKLSGNLTCDEISVQGIEITSRYVDACAGAIYRCIPENGRCELAASYAMGKGKLFSPAFKPGQGIVGQVASQKKSILLQNISSEDAIGESGTLSRPPAAIFAIPLIFKGTLLGVLEIASFEPITKIKQTFLITAGKIISLMLQTATQNDRIKDLLKTAQEANEKLQTQTEELQAQAEELQALNQEFQQQSNELQEQNRELETQRQKVEESNRLKSEFLSNMSHELRTPLNSVNALSRVLIVQTKHKLSDEEINYLEIIERNGKHLLYLINDILDLSKIEAGRMDLNPTCFSIASLIDNIMESIAPLACGKNILLEKQISNDLPDIESDESRVHQILQNIISNAVKFTDRGSVVISAQKTQDNITIVIKDTGIGIPSEDHAAIFEEFRQVDGASTRKFEGTGLGLAIASKAARLLGGAIHVTSTPGIGSEFMVSLPIVFTGHRKEKYVKEKHVFEKTIARPGKKTDDRQNKTILIVDDDPAILETISTAFSDEGYHTLTATSGARAIELAREHQPFAITLDIIMPEMDGWEVLNALKHDPSTSGIPVIVISSSDEKDTGFALGAVGYISKPVCKDMLIREINKIYGYLPSSVLVVDDNDIDRTHIARILVSEGMKVLQADSGKNCLTILETVLPDILILDLMMPEMDGFELLKSLRSHPATENLPVIVVTAKDLTPDEKEKLEQQVSSILVKSNATATQLILNIKKILTRIGKKGLIPHRTRTNAVTLDQKSIRQMNRILMVEDNDAAIIQVKSVLEARGITVDVAHDGQQALDYVQHTIPEGIILDLMMPDIDGFQVLETIRSTPVTRKIPVLILTAKDLTEDDLNRLSSNNIQQLVQKGDVDKEELVNKVRQMLSIAAPCGCEPKTLSPDATIFRPPSPSRENGLPVILVVEDNPDNMATLKAVIEKKNIIREAIDGEQAIQMAMQLIPDLILLDMSLPGMDGFSVMTALKKNKTTANIPVVAITAQAMKGDKEKILAAGCDDYIAKPIDPETIMNTINSWITTPHKEEP
ncbi:MAG: response regulator [Pseudomonadota bacterium]